MNIYFISFGDTPVVSIISTRHRPGNFQRDYLEITTLQIPKESQMLLHSLCWHMWQWAVTPSGRLGINWDNVKDDNNGANLCLLLRSLSVTVNTSVTQII